MKWIEVIFNVEREQLKDVCSKLDIAGENGYIIEDEEDFNSFISDNRQFWGMADEELVGKYKGASRVKLYIEKTEKWEDKVEYYSVLLNIDPQLNEMEDQDWENSWKDNYEVINIGEDIAIVPYWLEEPENKISVKLNPGLAFGTGTHETTKLCAEFMEKTNFKDKKVLDIGCGSGILTILAYKLGGGTCVGCDIDIQARNATAENAELNGIEGSDIPVYVGDILSDKGLQKEIGNDFDVVIANIVADVIIPLCSIVKNFMKKDSVLIISGIQTSRIEEVIEAINLNGLSLIDIKAFGEWNSMYVKLYN